MPKNANLTLVVLSMAGYLITGCHSHFVTAIVENRTGAAVGLLEVDYPSAGFGADHLAAGASYPYRFKIQGSGRVSVSYDDATGHHHTAKGPLLDEGESGELKIVLKPAGEPEFTTSFRVEQ